tara:strand:- start:6307 stop:6921 length:615 start_codon:yes stop_codon:yes gene_type:complete
MINTNLKFTILLMLFIPLISISQNSGECYNTVSFCPVGKRLGFTKNMQSYSGAFEQGDTSVVTIVVYKGMEYRISICSPSHSHLDGQFQFKISEKVTKGVWKEETSFEEEIYYDEDGYEQVKKIPTTVKRRVYESEEVVRYDNTDDEMSQQFIFQSNKTRKLNIKVYVPSEEGGEMYSGLSGSNYACVGLLIEHQPGIVTGFNR